MKQYRDGIDYVTRNPLTAGQRARIKAVADGEPDAVLAEIDKEWVRGLDAAINASYKRRKHDH